MYACFDGLVLRVVSQINLEHYMTLFDGILSPVVL